MRIKNNLIIQNQKLKEVCLSKGIDYSSLEILLNSVKAKKIKRVNYHQQKIADIIEKAVK
ncbi:DNA modification system-associated small protein [Empedobacter falsenii]